MTNEKRLKQILINLLSNAYKFTASGTITLAANIYTSIFAENFVRFSVIDSGEGLSEEEKKLLFKPFSKVERNQYLNSFGSGLGLVIVKEIVDKLESTINFTSDIGKGTKFYFDLRLNNIIKKKKENTRFFSI